MVTEFPNVIQGNSLREIYRTVVDNQIWYLSRGSVDGQDSTGQFPGSILLDDNYRHPTLAPYFMGLFDTVRSLYLAQTGKELPPRILRIHLVAKNESSRTFPHIDADIEGAVSIVGFLTPEWKPEWGGELSIGDSVFPYTPGKFIAFPSNIEHDGVGSIQPTPYWRVVVNYICVDQNFQEDMNNA